MGLDLEPAPGYDWAGLESGRTGWFADDASPWRRRCFWRARQRRSSFTPPGRRTRARSGLSRRPSSRLRHRQNRRSFPRHPVGRRPASPCATARAFKSPRRGAGRCPRASPPRRLSRGRTESRAAPIRAHRCPAPISARSSAGSARTANHFSSARTTTRRPRATANSSSPSTKTPPRSPTIAAVSRRRRRCVPRRPRRRSPARCAISPRV